MSPTGRLITFEGIDGSGKSTQARRLAEALRAAGGDPVLTREPGGSPGAEEVRALLVGGAPERWSPETEVLLFTAARRDHLERTMEPALEEGRDVVCDRFVDSTRVYQGLRREGLRGLVDALHTLVIGREANLTFILDADPEVALVRGLARGTAETRFERLGVGFQARLRHGFLDLAREAPQRCRVVDAMAPPDAVAARIAELAGL